MVLRTRRALIRDGPCRAIIISSAACAAFPCGSSATVPRPGIHPGGSPREFCASPWAPRTTDKFLTLSNPITVLARSSPSGESTERNRVPIVLVRSAKSPARPSNASMRAIARTVERRKHEHQLSHAQKNLKRRRRTSPLPEQPLLPDPVLAHRFPFLVVHLLSLGYRGVQEPPRRASAAQDEGPACLPTPSRESRLGAVGTTPGAAPARLFILSRPCSRNTRPSPFVVGNESSPPGRCPARSAWRVSAGRGFSP